MENWIQVISLFVAISVMMGGMFAFMWGRIDKKFESVDKRFDLLFQEIKEIKISIQSLEIRVGRLETQDEERFRNEIKLLVSERKIQQ